MCLPQIGVTYVEAIGLRHGQSTTIIALLFYINATSAHLPFAIVQKGKFGFGLIFYFQTEPSHHVSVILQRFDLSCGETKIMERHFCTTFRIPAPESRNTRWCCRIRYARQVREVSLFNKDLVYWIRTIADRLTLHTMLSPYNTEIFQSQRR